MHKALHPIDDFDRLYVSRKVRGRGIARLEDRVDISIQRLEVCLEKHEWGTKWQYIGNKNGKENNSMGVLND